MTSLPDGLLVAWCGDDYTGAAAVMEVLAFAGLPTMLFLDVPGDAQLARHRGLRAIGVATTARTWSPDQMASRLPGAFQALCARKPAIFHYKICSTLDSSPALGSIGKAIEIGADLLAPRAVPVLVAAPQMRRYQIFGHLFAGHGDQVFRLDRHPVMAHHPVTPMAESDVMWHIAAQSDRIAPSNWSQMDIAAQRAPAGAAQAGQISVFSMDCHDPASESAAGGLIWNGRAHSPFVVGSQGVEYALVRHWIETGALAPVNASPCAGPARGMVAVSGSVSPTTADQIAWSRNNGFATIRLDAALICSAEPAAEMDRVVAAALAAASSGSDPLIYTAQGPDDPAVAGFRHAVGGSGVDIGTANRRVGQALGEVLHRILRQSGMKRAVISGGDTSGHAAQQLGIYALSALAPTIPGASLCKAHADGPMDGLELALKGGQMGSPDYFGWIRAGGGKR